MKIHNILNRGTISDFIKRALGDTKSEGGTERYSETLDVVCNPWGLPEWAYLRSERLCAIWRTVGATVGEFGALALVNPAGSEVIAVVEQASIDTGTAPLGLLQLATEATVLATLAGPAPGNTRDRRFLPVAATHLYTLVGTDPSPTIGVAIERRRVAAINTLDFLYLPLVLAPGQAAVVVLNAANTAFDGEFCWRERVAYPGELI